MDKEIYTIKPDEYPNRLKEIDDVPNKLYARGSALPDSKKYLTVVGSRKYTSYGKQVCQSLITGLRGSDICIVSGLALGIDAIAHKAALSANLDCVAVPGSGLSDDVLYPRTNVPVAEDIVQSGGVLVSEFEPDREAASWTFPQRNRIMAGLAHAVLIIEATEDSGTLITANLAADFNRDIFTVPGSIKDDSRAGPHQLIRDGAALIRSAEDIQKELGLQPLADNANDQYDGLSDQQRAIVDALGAPKTKEEIVNAVGAPAHEINILLSQMELSGIIQESDGKFEKV